jgi:hypothetical protein
MDLAEKLAQLILAFDEDYPGDPDAAVEVPPQVWLEWIDLAGRIDAEDK